MKWILRLMGMGLIIWLMPGATSFGRYDRSGKLAISLDVLKAIGVALLLSTGIEKLQQRSPKL